MSFWNNPEYYQFKALILIVILGGGGFFVSKFAGSPASSQVGSILEATRDTSSLSSGTTVATVTEINKEVERLNKVRTSDMWYIGDRKKKKAEESLVETLEVRKEAISLLALEGKTTDQAMITLSKDVVALLPDIAQIDIETLETIKGELYTEHADDFENPENSYVRSFVVTEDGKHYNILPTKDMEYARASVTITGKISGSTIIGDPEPIQIKSTIHKHSHSNTIKAVSDIDLNLNIANKIAFFLVGYEDTEDSVPFTREEAEAIFLEGSWNNFFEDQSYGKISFTGDVFGWYTVPRSSDPCKTDIEDELSTFILEDGIDLSDYDHIAVYNYCDEPNQIYAGISTFGDSVFEIGGIEYEVSALWITDAGISGNTVVHDTDPIIWTRMDNVFSHELGHSLGLLHSSGLDCGNESYTAYGKGCVKVEYGDDFDTMGGGTSAFHFNGFYKSLLEWIEPSEIQTITKSGTYSIGVFESSSTLKKYAQIKNPNFKTDKIVYSIEYRKGIGFDYRLNDPDQSSNQQGLLIRKVTYNTGGVYDDIYLLDARPTEAHWSIDAAHHASLNMGKQGPLFKDESNGITIGPVVAMTPTNVVFKVTIDNSSCIRRVPIIELDPYSDNKVEREPDGSLSYDDISFVIINTDSVFCSDTSLFDYTIDVSSMGLLANEFEFDADLKAGTYYDDIDIDFNDGAIIDKDEVLPGIYPVIVTATNLTSGLTSEPFTFNMTVE